MILFSIFFEICRENSFCSKEKRWKIGRIIDHLFIILCSVSFAPRIRVACSSMLLNLERVSRVSGTIKVGIKLQITDSTTSNLHARS